MDAPTLLPADGWTRPTTESWQRFEDRQTSGSLEPPWRYGVPIFLPDGRVLRLPIRRLPPSDGPARPGDRAVASLIANQAALDVVDRLAASMAELAREFAPDVVVGLPTLGFAFAPGVARGLGHTRWVPLGYSRKFWYDDALSTEVASITTPGAGKRLYLDPHQRPLLAGRRVVVVDDVVSSARTLSGVWPLLEAQGAQVAGVVVAMRQGDAWREALGAGRSAIVRGVFDSPLLVLGPDGWHPAPAPAASGPGPGTGRRAG